MALNFQASGHASAALVAGWHEAGNHLPAADSKQPVAGSQRLKAKSIIL
jgi:hypothetical protein